MSNNYFAQFQKYQEMFNTHHVDNSVSFNFSEKDAEVFLGFPVKEISAHIPKSSVLETQHQFVENKLAKLFIIGSAFPKLDGWKMFSNKDTVFVAQGFNDTCQPFKFNFNPELLEIETIELNPTNLNDWYHITVDYQEGMAQAMSAAEFKFGHSSVKLS